MRPYLRAAAIVLLAACGRDGAAPVAPAPAAASRTQRDPEASNLLGMVRGGSVVSRTAEMTLEQTPARLIDGEVDSHWTTPPNDVQQSCVLSMPARARIDSFSLGTLERPAFAAKSVRIETSTDGTTFRPAITFELQPNSAMQTRAVTPVEARFVRVSIDSAHSGFAALTAIQAQGQLLETPRLPDLSGCWEINGAQASLQRTGNSVRGWMDWEGTLILAGGADEGFYRFAWIDGPQYGLAAVTLTPDGRHLTGMKWHERAEPLTFGTTWFGDKGTECDAKGVDADAVARLWLKQAGRFPLFGLRFDAQDRLVVADSSETLERIARIVAATGRAELVSNELREATPEANRARTATRIQTLREELVRRGVDASRVRFVAAGSDNPPERMPSRLILGMLSTVEIRVAGSAF